jgi:hypothetical protein
MKIIIFVDEETGEIWYYTFDPDEVPIAIDTDILTIKKDERRKGDDRKPTIH